VNFPKERSAAHFCEFLQLLEPNWKNTLCSTKGVDDFGAPRIIILSSAMGRATTLLSVLHPFNLKVPIGKIFSKKMNFEDQCKFLQSNICQIALGTPNRALKLADFGALKLHRLKYLVIDLYKNIKDLNILEFDETKKDIFQFFRNHIRNLLAGGDTNICFF